MLKVTYGIDVELQSIK